jgi:hypothetical protein
MLREPQHDIRRLLKINYQTFSLATEQTVFTKVMPLTKSEVACTVEFPSVNTFFCSNWYATPIIIANTSGASNRMKGFEFVNSFFIVCDLIVQRNT